MGWLTELDLTTDGDFTVDSNVFIFTVSTNHRFNAPRRVYSHFCYVAMLYACFIAFGALALGSVFYLIKWIGD